VTEQSADEVLAALDALVEAVAVAAAQIDLVTNRSEAVHSERARGATYSEIVSGGGPLVPQAVTANLTELLDASSRLRRAQAKALYAEGLSMHHIARLFQVSRQRVSALLRAAPVVNENQIRR
jgi:hypothetical protein